MKKQSQANIPLNLKLSKPHLDYLNELAAERKQGVSQVLKTIIDAYVNMELMELLGRVE
ncbi:MULTISPECIES: hypothetical protein [Pseudomonas]|uniref:hypothetical protein n=1 Tax=Pseudomonas TaxID=286 RepID=UPI000919B9F4|nr:MULTISPECIES: hypothetical protein [Pseudomonas]SHI35562.1 hypothetical protein SAMN05216295_101357 [Pseudomonas zeshuii]